MRTKHVVVEEYSERWPVEFERLRAFLMPALESAGAMRLEHVGSTSVPGLCAKPIIDMDAVIPDELPLSAVTKALAALGYSHEGDLGIPGREAFRSAGGGFMAHHLYVCRESCPELRRHIAFRDLLRCSPASAAEYGRIKREGAALYPYDIDAYIRHKGPFIEGVYSWLGL